MQRMMVLCEDTRRIEKIMYDTAHIGSGTVSYYPGSKSSLFCSVVIKFAGRGSLSFSSTSSAILSLRAAAPRAGFKSFPIVSRIQAIHTRSSSAIPCTSSGVKGSLREQISKNAGCSHCPISWQRPRTILSVGDSSRDSSSWRMARSRSVRMSHREADARLCLHAFALTSS